MKIIKRYEDADYYEIYETFKNRYLAIKYDEFNHETQVGLIVDQQSFNTLKEAEIWVQKQDI